MAITSEFVVERRQWVTYDASAPRGSGYCKDFGQYNLLIKVWKWRGFTIWERVMDREEVPSFVWIAEACYGNDIKRWTSMFEQYMPYK